MSYLEDFKYQINQRDFHKFFQLWEEYSRADHVDYKEFMQLLNMIKASDFAALFGRFVDTAIPLWQTMKDEEESYQILARLIDLQTTNTPLFSDLAYQALEKRYGNEPEFKENIKQIGLRSKEAFQGAVSNYDLLRHLRKGNFVYHHGGWGAGEVVDFSRVREQVAIEFENVSGIKHLSFDNAFKTLVPLQNTHFLARRFSNPDKFEMEAKKDPVAILKILLRDLGPKTAAEIKDELCVLVIPDADWTKWWQGARGKLKKDTMVETPSSLKEPFKLREIEVSHFEKLQKSFEKKMDAGSIIQTTFAFARDLPDAFRKEKDSLKQKMIDVLSDETLSKGQEFQVILFLESVFGHQIRGKEVQNYVESMPEIEGVVNDIEIVALKKRALQMIREHRIDWSSIFLNLLFVIQPASIKDYIFKELSGKETQKDLKEKLEKLLRDPFGNPDAFLWYFQKVAKKDPGAILFGDKEGRCQFLESLLILLHKIENEQEYRDLTKKIYNLLTAKRFEVIRLLIEGSSEEFIKEFMLLVSKCQTFGDHETKILHSLAFVVHPSLAPEKKQDRVEECSDIIWTTEEGYLRIQSRLQTIGTVEMIENAREVEAARSLGDLRENSEYKFACEKRARLQGEMKTLSKQLSHARVITPHDVPKDEVGPGSIVDIIGSSGQEITYKILGPWDADAENNIISYQSQFAAAMLRRKRGETFQFRDENFKILEIRSYLG